MRAIEHLDMVPELELQAYFDHPNLGSFLRIRNPGPIRADQLIVGLYLVRRVTPQHPGVIIWKSGMQWEVGDIQPLADTLWFFDSDIVNSMLISTEPIEQNVLVIRLEYRHPSHAQQYFSKAFFFLNPERKWVGEHDSSLDPSIYDPIKSVVIDNWSDEFLKDIGGTTLHTSEE